MTNASSMFRTIILLAGLSLLWGVSFLFVEYALLSFSPLVVVQLRVSIGAGLLLLLVLALGQGLPKTGRFWRVAFAMGLFNNVVPFLAIVTAQTSLNSGVTSILNATMPFYTVLIALALREVKSIVPTLFGVVVGFLGVVILADWSDVAARPPLWALGLMTVSAVSYSIAVYIGRQLNGLGTTTQAATGMLMASTVLVLPFAGVMLVQEVGSAQPLAWVGVVGIGAFSTALAYLFYFGLVRHAGPTVTSLVTFLLPVIALGLGALLLGERYDWRAFAGCGLIFSGLGVVFWTRWRSARS